jgi:serine/threonine protein kinase
MNDGRLSVKDILLEALEIEDAGLRAAFLSRVCGTDQALRQEVEELLSANAAAGQFLPEQPGSKAAESLLPAALRPITTNGTSFRSSHERLGDRIGHYRLLQKIGEGGCGTVYLAQQEVPVRRKVAVKIIKLGMDTKQVVARFEAERQALALMDHPNIARVFDAGATETGRPFFVMELVRGIKITDYCDQNTLSARDRLGLFIQVCQAVQHAHQKGIIHRDLKPSNILVTVNDGMAVPKVIDFGIAKAIEGKLTDQTVFTALEQFLGTPAYMSPEQALMTSIDIDTRSDIYSLGVLLYELLTGNTPFDTRELLKAGLDEMRQVIREQEPARPSTRLSALTAADLGTVSHYRRTEAPKLMSLLRGDLDWIVMKCLEKDRTLRYETANGLATDVKRFLNGEAVVARPPSASYRLQKLVRRNKVLFTAAAAVTASLIFGLGLSTWLFIQERRARWELRQNAVAAAAVARNTLARYGTACGNRLADEGDFLGALPFFVQALKLEQGVSLSEQNHRLRIGALLEQCPKINKMWFLGAENLNGADLARDGRYLITAGTAGTAMLCDVSQDSEPQPWCHGTQEIEGVSFSPNGNLVAISGKRFVQVYERTTHKLVWSDNPPDTIYSVRFSPDGSQLAAAGKDDHQGHVYLYDMMKDGHKTEFPTGSDGYRWAAFSPDGKRLVTACLDGKSQVCDAETGMRIFPLTHPAGVKSAEFSPDGRYIVTAGWDFEARIWDASTGELVYPTLKNSDRLVMYASFTPDGRRVLTVNATRCLMGK